MKKTLTHPLITYDHTKDDVSEVSDYLADLKNQKKQLSAWYVVYEEAIIFCLLVTLFATAI
jgi:hypothetical protein